MSLRRRMTPAELATAKEGAKRKRQLRRLWGGDSTLEEICEQIGLSQADVMSLAARMRLGERRTPDFHLPTREEILLAAAQIRQGWTQAEREARRAGGRSGRLNE